MDLDALAAARREEWERLDRLGRARSLSGAEADELIERYRSAATDLSAVRSSAGRTALGDRLSVLIGRARLRFAGTAANPLERIPVFFALQLPAALYRIRWLTLGVAAAFLLVAALYAVWVAASPELVAALGAEADLEGYAKEAFTDYYSEYSGGAFASMVWTNNAWVATQCIAFGVFGVFGPAVLLQNAQGIGLTAGVMAEYDRLDVFFQYIAPHGQLELYSIWTACAAGLMIFWAWVAPGARTRGQALAEDGRALFAIVIGLIGALLVSGLIEGWITRQDWPWPIKAGIGTLALAAFLGYQWIVGRRAHRAGQTGDLAAFEAGATRLVAG